jgi:hypothetical protein
MEQPKRKYEDFGASTQQFKTVRLMTSLELASCAFNGDVNITMDEHGVGVLVITQDTLYKKHEEYLVNIKGNPKDTLAKVLEIFDVVRNGGLRHIDLELFGIDKTSTNYEFELFAKMAVQHGVIVGTGLILRIPLKATKFYGPDTKLTAELDRAVFKPPYLTASFITPTLMSQAPAEIYDQLVAAGFNKKLTHGYKITPKKYTSMFLTPVRSELVPQILNNVSPTQPHKYIHRDTIVVTTSKK